VNDFMECLKAGRDSSINFAEAFKTHRVIFAIDKAIAEGRPVKLSKWPV